LDLGKYNNIYEREYYYSMAETLYERVGGEEAIEKVVEYFYNELVLKDETVNHFFKGTDMKKQIGHQAKFISFVLGGPKQ
jgi:hemoglobin